MRILASFLALCFLAGCALYRNQVLEAKDTQFLKVEESSIGPNGLQLAVSGLAFKSAMSVETVELKKYEESEINVLVHLTQSREGLSGRFSKIITVPAEVKIVTFGSSRTAIWSRKMPNIDANSG
jgi:hypothetical protein